MTDKLMDRILKNALLENQEGSREEDQEGLEFNKHRTLFFEGKALGDSPSFEGYLHPGYKSYPGRNG